MSGIVNKVKAKVDDVLHKDKTHDTTHTTGTHSTTGTHGTTGGLTGSTHTHGSDPTGPHSSHAANKVDPRVDSDHYGTTGNTAGAGGVGAGQYGSTGTHTTGGLTGSSHAHSNDPTGPHSSHLANKADPRVDSDRYGTAGNTAGAGGVGAGQYGSSHTGTHGTTGGLTGGSHTTHGSAGGLGQSHATSHGDPSGPHSSSLANKLDPTVDTKSYGTANPSTGHYASGGNTHGTTGGLTGGSHNTHGTTGYSDPTGPHDSRIANKADPRVDSDRYGAAGNTSGAGGYGAGQYGSNTGSGLTGSHGTAGHGNTVGSGNSNTTAGPHNSDVLNKLDPRVDSDLDGSKTVGGNQTYH